MSVPAEVLKKILLQQQEQLNLIATWTQKFQLQDTDNSDSIDLVNTITELSYDAENGYTFNAWFLRWHDTFQHEFPDKDDNWKKRWLIGKLGTKENQRFIKFILPKQPSDLTFTETIAILSDIFREQSLFNIRYNCFKIAKSQSDDYVPYAGRVNHECERFHLQRLTEDQFKCLIFIAGLHSPDDSEICSQLLVKLETDEKVTVQGLTAECNRLLKLRKDTMLVQQQSSLFSQPSQVSPVHSNKSQSSNKFPPFICWSCGEWHYARFFFIQKNISARCTINVVIRKIFAVLQMSNLLITKLIVSLLTKLIKKWISGENHIQCLLLSK